jgi:asparagine synthase (glutamine-hydrolysing)
MCGIIGGFGETVDSTALKQSMKGLIHRGPDSQCFKGFPGNCFMGVARLAMTDPHPRSNQPFVTENAEFAIGFNGEIYNFKSLRENLKSKNIEFKTESDTEVLLQSLRTWGVVALEKLEGMFAFAFYDVRNEKLIIARDKLGKKPLYYSVQNRRVYWSSSLELLAKVMNVDYTISDAGIDFMALGYQLDPNTGYEGIQSLLPGHYLEFQTQYMEPRLQVFPRTLSRKSRPDTFRNEFNKAIQIRIEGHNKVGLSLSGGVDSTLIALGLKELGVKAETFSAFWSNSDKTRYNSDAEHAKKIANALGHEFFPIDVSSDFSLRETLHDFLLSMEEPNNNPSGLSTTKLYRAVANNGIRLLLTGDGSDEIFGGYARHHLVAKVPRLLSLNNQKLDQLLYSRDTRINKIISNFIASQMPSRSPKLWLHWHLVFTPKEISLLFRGLKSMEEISVSLTEEVERLSPTPSIGTATQSIMERDHQVWLSMESNKKLDRISMKYSIEARSPFQDDNIIEYASIAMERHKFKRLDKKLLRDEFPELQDLPIMNEKVGFTSPIGYWMRSDPDFTNSSIDYLAEMPEFNGEYLAKFKNSQFQRNFRTNMQLWTLVVYANWLMINNGD